MATSIATSSMATSIATSSMTIWHQDILDITCSYLTTPSIKELRLISRSISDIATPFLFRTLRLSLRFHRLDRLEYVSRHNKFASSVREIVWDTSSYRECWALNEDLFIRNRGSTCLHLDFSTDSKKRHKQKQHVLRRYKALAGKEMQVLNLQLLIILTSAFKTLSKLTRVRFVAWAYPVSEEGIYSRSRFEAPDYDPPTLKNLDPAFNNDPDHQDFAFDLVLHALHGAGRTLHHLDVAEVENDEVQRQMQREKLLYPPRMLIHFDRLNTLERARAADALKSLRSLHLSLFDGRPSLHRAASQGKLRNIISGMASLESLELKFDGLFQFHNSTNRSHVALIGLAGILGTGTFSHLRNFGLQHFWLEADELCDFLLRHSSTLQTLALDYLRLEAKGQVERGADGIGMEIEGKPLPEDMKSDWYRVARVCQQLPKQKGLQAVWGFRDDWMGPVTYLQWIDRMQEVMERGMACRHNVYGAAAAAIQDPIAHLARQGVLEMAESAS